MSHSRKLTALVGTGALALLAALPAACAPKSSAINAKVAALRELRDSGVITPEQYAQRLSQVGGSSEAQVIPAAASFGGARRAHVIEDPQFGMAALRVTAPADWRFQGEMTRQGQCAAPAGTPHWRAEAPDGAYGVEVSALSYGTTSSQGENAQRRQQGCVESGATQADEILRAYAQQRHPGGRIVGSQVFTDADPMLQQQRAQIQSQMASLPPEMQGQVIPPVASGAQVRIAYTSNGRALEEAVSGIDVCFSSQSLNYGSPPTRRLSCTVNPLMIVDAPQGKLDDFGPKALSVAQQEANPTYLQAMAQSNGADRQRIIANGRETLNNTNRENSEHLNQIIANNDRAIANIHELGHRSMMMDRDRSDQLHRSSQDFANSMGDKSIYTDTDGRTFTGSNQYSHTYVDGRGNALQTNSAYPPGVDWTETPPH